MLLEFVVKQNINLKLNLPQQMYLYLYGIDTYLQIFPEHEKNRDKLKDFHEIITLLVEKAFEYIKADKSIDDKDTEQIEEDINIADNDNYNFFDDLLINIHPFLWYDIDLPAAILYYYNKKKNEDRKTKHLFGTLIQLMRAQAKDIGIAAGTLIIKGNDNFSFLEHLYNSMFDITTADDKDREELINEYGEGFLSQSVGQQMATMIKKFETEKKEEVKNEV